MILKGCKLKKKFPLCKCFLCKLFYLQEFQIRVQFMTKIIYEKRGKRDYFTVSDLSAWFLWLWSNVSVKKKFFCTIWILLCFVLFFVAQWLIVPSQRSSYFLGGISEPWPFFQVLSIICYDFEYICFKKKSVNFFTFYIILSYFSQLRA